MDKSLSEMTLEELWELFPVTLSEHRSCWSDWYREEETRISGFLPIKDIPFCTSAHSAKCIQIRDARMGIRISHIGSTAIRDIWAKPIIDILLEISPNGFYGFEK